MKAANINDLIVYHNDYNDLYTSNHWRGIISSWVQVQTIVLKNDDKMIADAKIILNKLSSPLIYTDFVTSLTKELKTAGKEKMITELTDTIRNSNKLLNYDGVLSIYSKNPAENSRRKFKD